MADVFRIVVAAFALAASAAVGAATAIDGFEFDDPAQAERYQALIAEFRCPKCLNTNLAGSDAPIASDLRRTVRRLMNEGAADGEIRDFLQSRYGDFVLYDPPFKPATWALWLTPVLLVLVGLVVLRRIGARSAAVVATDAELARLAQVTGEGGTEDGPTGGRS